MEPTDITIEILKGIREDLRTGLQVREMRDAFLADHSLRARVDDHERRLAAIEKHAG